MATIRLQKFKYVLVTLLVIFAVLTAGFRYLLEDISSYIPVIEQKTKEQTGLTLHIESLTGRWLFYSPLIQVKGISLESNIPSSQSSGKDSDNEPKAAFVKLDGLDIELDILESLFQLQPRFKRILLEGFEVSLRQNEEKMSIVGFDVAAFHKANNFSQGSLAKHPLEPAARLLDQYILSSEKIYLNDIEISLDLTEMPEGKITIEQALLDNEWLDHLFLANVLLDDGVGPGKVINFKSNFQGNPLRLEQFSAKNYLSIGKSDLSFWLPNTYRQGVLVNHLEAGAQVWVDIKKGKPVQVSGKAQFENVGLIARQGELIDEVDALSFDFEWRSEEQGSWQVGVKDLNLIWGDLNYQDMGFLVHQGVSSSLSHALERKWSEIALLSGEQYRQYLRYLPNFLEQAQAEQVEVKTAQLELEALAKTEEGSAVEADVVMTSETDTGVDRAAIIGTKMQIEEGSVAIANSKSGAGPGLASNVESETEAAEEVLVEEDSIAIANTKSDAGLELASNVEPETEAAEGIVTLGDPADEVKSIEAPANSGDHILVSRLSLNYFPLEVLYSIANLLDKVEPSQLDIIKQLDLRGDLQEFQLVVTENTSGETSFYLSGNVERLGLEAFKKMPSLQGLDLYFEVAPGVAGIEVDANDMTLSEHINLFRRDVVIEELKGNLLLEMIPGDWVVHSDKIFAKSKEHQAEAIFSMSIPDRVYQDGSREIPSWSLHTIFEKTEAKKAIRFVPGNLPSDFLGWLDNGVLDGKVSGDVFLFAFGKKRLPDTFFTLDSELRVSQAELDYLPGEWPAVHSVGGEILLHNEQVKTQNLVGKMYDTELLEGQITIPSYLVADRRVLIEGKTHGPLVDAKSLFTESTLKDSVGTVVESWSVEGEADTTFSFDFPLGADLPDVQRKESVVGIDVDVVDSSLGLPDLELQVDEINGHLKYSLSQGLSADELNAQFFNEPVTGKVRSYQFGEEEVTHLSVDGSIDASSLRSWTPFFLFKETKGKAVYQADLTVGSRATLNLLDKQLQGLDGAVADEDVDGGVGANEVVNGADYITRVKIYSDLENVSVNLPGSYNKAKQGKTPTTVTMDVLDEVIEYQVDYDGRVNVAAVVRGTELEKAHMAFGADKVAIPLDKGMIISGYIGRLNFDEWLAYLEEKVLDEESDSTDSLDAGSDPAEPAEDPAEFLNYIDVTMGIFTGFGQDFTDIKTFVTRGDKLWRVEVENKMMGGAFSVPDDELITKENPVLANLEYLRISEEQFSAAPEQVTISAESENADSGKQDIELIEEADIVPDDFTFINLKVKNVTIDNTSHGRWEIDLYPDENGLDFDVHQLHYGVMSINGKGRWDYSAERSVTKFKGHIKTGAIVNLFSALKLTPSAKSGGLMALDIQWPGDPMDFDPDKMKGKAGLEILDGSIIEIDIRSGKLKALGIFNLGFLTDIVTLKVFKKIGKGLKIDKLLGLDDDKE